ERRGVPRETETSVTTAAVRSSRRWTTTHEESQGGRSAAARDVWARAACSLLGEMAVHDGTPAMPGQRPAGGKDQHFRGGSSCLLRALQSPAGQSERRRTPREGRRRPTWPRRWHGREAEDPARPRGTTGGGEKGHEKRNTEIRGCSEGGRAVPGSAPTAPSAALR
ncbi:hypothetical protein THAOC_14998, partial [Thalassiosira oceanica]